MAQGMIDVDLVEGLKFGLNSNNYIEGWNDAIDEVIKLAIAVDTEPVRHGKWMWVDGVRCSQCNYKLTTTGLPSYCPSCGAYMRGTEDD